MKVTISDRAERNLDGIVLYLEKEWSIGTRDRFLVLLKKKILLITKMPYLYQASAHQKAIRSHLKNPFVIVNAVKQSPRLGQISLGIALPIVSGSR